MGVAILRRKMFVVFNRSSEVHVYHADSIEMHLETVFIPDMEWPQQIVACATTEKLFVADMQKSQAGCVWRLSADGDFDRHLPNSQDPEPLWPRSVAVSDGRLLVVSFPNILLLYAVGGRRLRKVELPRDMEVQHAVATDHNTFLVALSRAENTLVLLREVDLHGNDVRHCPVEFILPIHFVRYPVGPCCRYQGHVVVADSEDNRVILLDDRLNFKHFLLHGDQVSRPRRLLLPPEADKGQLHVCGSSYVSLWKWLD